MLTPPSTSTSGPLLHLHMTMNALTNGQSLRAQLLFPSSAPLLTLHVRLQTRERYVQIAESNLVQKKKHCKSADANHTEYENKLTATQ